MKTLIHICCISLVLILAAGSSVADEKTQRSLAIEAGWPDTPVGEMAYRWVAAYTSDDEKIVASFLEENLKDGALKRRSMKDRLDSYRKRWHHQGILTLTKIRKSSDYELTVDMKGEDNKRKRYIFKLDKKAPHKLDMVQLVSHHGH